MSGHDLPVISLFSGALGLDLGLEQAGFQVRVAVECNAFAAETIRQNRGEEASESPVVVFERRLEAVKTRDLLKAAEVEKGGDFVISGGPSCQSFSTAGQRRSIDDPRGSMFREYLRVIREAKPRFFVMENVRGILSAAVKHRPLAERGPGYPPLLPEERLGSALEVIISELKALGYYVVFGLLNAADYGVPQTRERVVFIASRDGEPIELPAPTHSASADSGLPRWITLKEALEDLDDPDPLFRKFHKSKAKYLKRLKPGQNWRDLKPHLQKEALGKAYSSWGGRSGFLRRLAWDRPSPSLTSRPDSTATLFAHPDELRTLSVREYARIQGFPDDWLFDGGLPQMYLQIGNAVPVRLGEAIGRALKAAMTRRVRTSTRSGLVYCPDTDLSERLKERKATVLNPAGMRKDPSAEAAKVWLEESRSHSELDDLLVPERPPFCLPSRRPQGTRRRLTTNGKRRGRANA